MKQHAHCHFCGEPYSQDTWPRTCSNCSKQVWRNPIPVVVIQVTVSEDTFEAKPRMLIIKRGIAPRIGEWALPGGFMELGESWQECAARELKEETGLEFPPTSFHLLNINKADNGNMLIFCRVWIRASGIEGHTVPNVTDFTFTPNEETLAVDWVTQPQPLAFPTHTKSMAEFFRFQLPN